MLKNDKYIIKELEWDTNIFNVNAAKVILNKEITDKELRDIEQIVKENKYEFITIENKNNNEKNNILMSKLNNIFLADVNIQFKQEIYNNNYYNKNIKIENNFKYNDEVIKISKKAFIYSRFIMDENLNNNKYRIYEEWTKNAFEKDNKYFCYYEKNNIIFGYLLFSINLENKEILVELIAVNKEICNQGIGSKLLKKLKDFSYKNDIEFIKVGTQLNNLSAQNFYEKNGFKHIQNNSIYHWWFKY